ncbi:contractile injection system protein, VgrG/Pvc8 family [Oceanospirillum sediminis]|uniref:Phage late control D family protein n=1 Tax=Oceanospirillum sediminis TaxID=2760088 RepID=A0A839IXE6_9GAMM|nr:contractile injection system protein, VgrG/Pvc8 family [Oceanospirillum sediminis]MBB1489360.1 phage late control D family protein [Oceanospirillum sediminis]
MAEIRDLTPVCEITGAVAAIAQPRLISCTVVDAAGMESDSITIVIAAGDIGAWPETGQIIGCRMGYKEGKVVDLGRFKLQRVSQTLYPNTLTMTGTAARFDAKDPTELKRAQSKSWMNTTIGGIVSEIAGRHGFSPRIHGSLGGLPVEHMDQTEETDLKFLHRLADLHDAVCKPVDSLLVFAPRGQVKTMTGRVLEPVNIQHPPENTPTHPGYVTGTVSGPEKRQFNGCTAHWYDNEKAEEIKEEVGGTPRKRLPDRYDSKAKAMDAIKAEMHRITRQGDHLSLNCPGNPMLAAECLLSMSGFPIERMSGQWSIDRVTHTFNGSYRCSVNATRPV